jgi:CPA2 family monovalent cation:H+ antiporter-2
VILVGKAAVASVACLPAARSLRVAVATGLALAQVGEFSFILGRLGVDTGIVDPGVWQILLASSIVTMALTPLLVRAGPRVGAWLDRRRGMALDESVLAPARGDHVVVMGFGLGGRMIAKSLRELDHPYVVLELNGATVRHAKAQGEPILYADATHPDALRAAGCARACAAVVVLSDPDATARVLRTLRHHYPELPTIVRVRYRLEAERMTQLGATVAIAEELEGSLEVLAHVLFRIRAAPDEIEPLLDRHRLSLSSLTDATISAIGDKRSFQTRQLQRVETEERVSENL